MSDSTHLTADQLTRAVDGELDAAAQTAVETHLAGCVLCLEAYDRLIELSAAVAHSLEAVPVTVPGDAREQLAAALQDSPAAPARVRKHARREWAAWAVAAAVLLGAVLLVARYKVSSTPDRPPAVKRVSRESPPAVESRTPKQEPGQAPPSYSSSSRRSRPHSRQKSSEQKFANDEDGLNVRTASQFTRLPYSDPALPIQASDVVHVRLRVSTLANAGIIRVAPNIADGWVQADVLMGIDGEPAAIRLRNNETAPPARPGSLAIE